MAQAVGSWLEKGPKMLDPSGRRGQLGVASWWEVGPKVIGS